MENNQLIMTQNRMPVYLDKFLKSIDSSLGRDLDSINVFEWMVEDRFYNIITENVEYFSDRPDVLGIHNEDMLHEINIMIDHYVSIEEYERCSSLVKIKKELEESIKSM